MTKQSIASSKIAETPFGAFAGNGLPVLMMADRKENECCYPVYDCEKQVRTEDRATKLIEEMIGCECYTQRDPRGFMIRMYLVDENGEKWFNSWDGETVGLDW